MVGTVSSESDFAHLRDRLVALRLQTLVVLAEQPEDGCYRATITTNSYKKERYN